MNAKATETNSNQPHANGATVYDAIPYTESSFPQLDPARFGVIGLLAGREPKDPGRCRVLELGCGHGLSMVALAQKYPDSELIGIDLSRRQIENGADIARAADIGNVRLETMSIDDPEVAGLGAFDYIVCHGVYSWVPPHVQDAILAVCSRQLLPDGLAFISYNSLPGWGAAMIYRDVAVDMARRRDEPGEKVRLATAFLDAMAKSLAAAEKRPDRMMAQRMARRFRRGPASYLLHEYMEEFNQPCYFRDFARRAEDHGLSHAGENMLRLNFPVAAGGRVAGQVIRRLATDRIDALQLLDYFQNTQFHSSILRQGGAESERMALADLLERCALSTSLAAPEGLTLAEGVAQVFKKGTSAVTPTGAVPKAMLARIAASRTPLAWNELVAEARRRLEAEEIRLPDGLDPGNEIEKAKVLFQRMALSDLVGLSLPADNALRPAAEMPERPVATRLARSLAAEGKPPVNLLLNRRPVLRVTEYLLPLCDGSRSVEQLADMAADHTMEGGLPKPRTGRDKRELTGRNAIRDAYRHHIRHMLDRQFFLHEACADAHRSV